MLQNNKYIINLIATFVNLSIVYIKKWHLATVTLSVCVNKFHRFQYWSAQLWDVQWFVEISVFLNPYLSCPCYVHHLKSKKCSCLRVFLFSFLIFRLSVFYLEAVKSPENSFECILNANEFRLCLFRKQQIVNLWPFLKGVECLGWLYWNSY